MMKIEIWSDVICPFCYIGKRRLEEALQLFPQRNDIEVEWKSFQMNPGIKSDASLDPTQYLAEAKGWSIDYTRSINAQVTDMAAGAGLTYHLDRTVVANSFNAQRLSHLAKRHGLGDAIEEALFKAYFTDGKNIDDRSTLIAIGLEIGLSALEVENMLDADVYTDEVKNDIAEAQHLGIQGVPFFVLNNKYAISGTQTVPAFLETIEKAFHEWTLVNNTSGLQIIEGDSCEPNGKC